MSKFWVHIHEKHAFHISIEAPSLEAAETWAENHGMEFVYDTAREDDEVISADVDSVEAMSEKDQETYKDDIEVKIDETGTEIQESGTKEESR